mgnify:CR=1 FL=1
MIFFQKGPFEDVLNKISADSQSTTPLKMKFEYPKIRDGGGNKKTKRKRKTRRMKTRKMKSNKSNKSRRTRKNKTRRKNKS